MEININHEGEKERDVKKRKTIEDEANDNSVDIVSQLPDVLIKHIISFLPPKDIAATRTLSTTWRRLSPVLQHFSQCSHTKKLKGKLYSRSTEDEFQERRAKFLDMVDESLQSFCKQEENCRTFSLHMHIYKEEYGPRIDKWIELTADHNFHMLYFCFGITYPCYILPPTIFASKLLTVLRLDACDLKENCISGATRLDCLQELSLEHVHLSDLILNRLISISPSITNFSLILCTGVKYLRLLDLKRLKKVVVERSYENYGSDWIRRIKIESRTLRTFDFYGRCYYEVASDLNLQHCENLEILRLNDTRLPALFFEKLISNFPLLKSLFLLGSHNIERVKISSLRLEELDIVSLNNLVDATIDTPNLRSFTYSGNSFGPFLFSMKARLLQKARLRFGHHVWINASWFIKLRAFITKLNHIEVLSLSAPGRGTFDLKGLQENPVPGPVVHVKHLKLEMADGVSSSSSKSRGVDGILWSCHPETLTMQFGGHQDVFIQILTDKLNNREKDQMYCCRSTHIKCWRHDLKGVEIEQFTKTPKKKPLAKCQKISFRFKW